MRARIASRRTRARRSATISLRRASIPTTGHLIVESAQTSWEADGKLRGTVKDVDELVVEENGLKLGCYTFERNGTKMSRAEGPQRHFDKISDAVLEPGS